MEKENYNIRQRPARTSALVEGDMLAHLSELQLNTPEKETCSNPSDSSIYSEDFNDSRECPSPTIDSSSSHHHTSHNDTGHSNEDDDDSDRTISDIEEEITVDNKTTSDEEYILEDTESEEEELSFDEEESEECIPNPRKLYHEPLSNKQALVHYSFSSHSMASYESMYDPSTPDKKSLEVKVLEDESLNTTQDSAVIAQVVENDDEDDNTQSTSQYTPDKCMNPVATKTTNPKFQGVKKGKWTLGSKIGVGSFGVVHVGMNTLTGTLMAVKCIHVTSDTETMEDLEREINLMKSLNHIHIVRYMGVERDSIKGMLYIFQEWVPGGSVSSLLSKFGPFSKPVVRSYLQQIILGLKYLHSKHILHRDIKGGNVLVNDEGVVKLADFGASKQMLSGSESSSASRVEDAMENMTMRGTPYFMAVEVFEEKYGQKADIWSCACVAFQMITAQSPWKDLGLKSPMSLYMHLKKTEGPPPIPQEALVSMDPKLLTLFNLCFDRDPKKRPSASELLAYEFFQVVDETDESCDSFNSSKGLQSPPFLSPKDRMLLHDNKDCAVRKKSPQLLEYDTSEWPDWAKN